MDSTMIMPNIKKAGSLSLCFDVLIKIIEIIPEDMRTENLKAALVPRFKTDALYKTKANVIAHEVLYKNFLKIKWILY